MKRYLKTLRSEEAISKILENTKSIDDEEYIPVYQCKSRITSRPVFTRIPNPPFMCSAMDGYATSFKKTLNADLTNPVKLKKDVDATPVNTGDPLPKYADAVIMIEDIEESGTFIIIRKPVYLWQNVRMVGEDVIEGDMMIPTNHKISIFDMGMLISGGVSSIYVKRKPKIAIIPTGKELIDIFEEPIECNIFLEKNLSVDASTTAEGIHLEESSQAQVHEGVSEINSTHNMREESSKAPEQEVIPINSTQSVREGEAPTALPVEGATQAPVIGRLIDFNSYTLLKLSEEIGFDAFKTKIARNKNMLEEILNDVIEDYDVILLNAGTSAGREDYTSDIIQQMGTLIFHGVSMMPGKPTVFGIIKNKPVFGIPGYPVSAVLSFKTFVEPLYAKMSTTGFQNRYVKCITPYKIPSRVGIEEIIRVNLIEKQGAYYAFPLPRGASVFSSMANADGLIRIPEDIEGYNENEEVQCEIIGEEKDIKQRIHIIGSHDLSLDTLRDMMKVRHPDLDVISTHTGSLSGIFAFKKGVTQLCTTHIIDENEKIYNIPILKKYLEDTPFILYHIAKRLQGLLVRKGNPKNIKNVKDLTRPDIKFINRQTGSGTRILLDSILKEQGVEKYSINGYDREESSHTAVGILIRESIADVGVAIHSIARIFSLDFIPLAEEDYDLIVTKQFSEDRRFKMLMDIITSDEFKKRLEDMGGYDTKDTGRIKYINK